MFGRLVQKELLHHLLDFRFIAVFSLCALMSVLSVYVGGRNYALRLQEYNAVTENNRREFQESSLAKGKLWDMFWVGYQWNRRPETLSPVVYGLSGALGQEVRISYKRVPIFEASSFETDPIQTLFEVLDLAFIVKVVLSLAALLFTYDAICGEKEGGTLRLFASFAVPRSTLALAKLVGATLSVLIPFVFAYLLAAAVLASSQGAGLRGEDWGRIVALMGIFTLYLTVFVAFGLWVSGMTKRRMTAFLGLLGVWTMWLFILPNMAVDSAQRLIPVKSIYEFQTQGLVLRSETRAKEHAEVRDYLQRHAVKNWDALPEAQKEKVQKAQWEDFYKIGSRWDREYHARLEGLRTERRNQMKRQQGLAVLLSAISPLGAVSYVSMDLARTGLVQQERVENALNVYLVHLSQFIQDKTRRTLGNIYRGVDLTDFPWFVYKDQETLGDCLFRNAFYILNLALLAILGFAGAYVAILRYDVR